jgi:predicted dehydrogenase
VQLTSESQILRVGLVGLGKMGALHAALFNRVPNAKLVAITEKDQKITLLASKFFKKNISFYNDHNKMLEETSLNLIVITTPPFTHYDIIKDSVKKGVHIFAEKPLTIDYNTSMELVNLETNVKGMVGFQKRFISTFNLARKLIIDEELLGDLHLVEGYAFMDDIFKTGKGWRFDPSKGGGVLMEWGIHLIDLLTWFFKEVQVVDAFQISPFSKTSEDYVHVILKLPKTSFSYVDISWSRRGYRLPEIGLRIHGKYGSILVTDDKIVIELDTPRGDYDSGITSIHRAQLEERVDYLLGSPEYYLEDKAFVQSITQGTPPAISFRDACLNDKVIGEIKNHFKT